MSKPARRICHRLSLLPTLHSLFQKEASTSWFEVGVSRSKVMVAFICHSARTYRFIHLRLDRSRTNVWDPLDSADDRKYIGCYCKLVSVVLTLISPILIQLDTVRSINPVSTTLLRRMEVGYEHANMLRCPLTPFSPFSIRCISHRR